MTESPSPDALAREFDMFMSRAGITVPPARRAAILASYADFRTQLLRLHGKPGEYHSHVAEPAHIFSLPPSEAM